MKGVRPMRGRCQIRFTYKGRAYIEALDLPWSPENVAQAARIREDRIQRLRTGRPAVEAPVIRPRVARMLTFGEVAQQMLDHALVADADDSFALKLSSRNSARDLLNRFWLPALGKRPIADISLEELKAVAREHTTWKLKRKKNAYGAVRRVFDFAADEDRGYITTNPATTFSATPKNSRRRKKAAPDPYTAAERDTLLAWLHDNATPVAYAYFLLGFFSGARSGELIALTWADYDGESIYIAKARVRSQDTDTKTGTERRVLLPAWVCSVLNQLPTRFKKGHLFLNQYGRPYLRSAKLSDVFNEAHTKTGVRRSKQPNYPWRHTYASIGLTSGLQPAFLAQQLGHSLQMLLTTYAKWIPTEDSDRAKIERAFGIAPKVGSKLAH